MRLSTTFFTYAYLKPLNIYRYAEPTIFKSKTNRRKNYVELPTQVADKLNIKEGDSVESVTEPTRQTNESNTNNNEVRTELEVTESINNDTGNTKTNAVSVDSQQASHDNDEPEQQTLIRRSKRIMNKPNPAIPPDDIGDNDDPKDIDFA